MIQSWLSVLVPLLLVLPSVGMVAGTPAQASNVPKEDTENAFGSTRTSDQASQGSDGTARAVIEDPPGDPKAHVAGSSQDAPDALRDAVDILKAWAGPETEAAIEFGLQVQELDFDNAAVSIHFNLGAVAYDVRIPGPADCQAILESRRPNQTEPSYVRCLARNDDAGDGSAVVLIPKNLLVDESFVSFQHGMVLKDIWVESVSTPSADFSAGSACACANVTDRAPDHGVGPSYQAVQLGEVGYGHLALRTPFPTRDSNGESTTLVFPVTLSNLGSGEDVVSLDAESVPPTWSVRLPQAIRVEGDSQVTFPVIVTMEFTHSHGVTETIVVRAESGSHEGVYAALPLSVHWLEIPQPAGHHPVQHLHSTTVTSNDGTSSYVRVWMNSNETDPDPAATDVNAPPVYAQIGRPPATPSYYQWLVPLQPSLRIGLDFDVSRTAQFIISIMGSVSGTNAVLNATLLHCDPTGNRSGPDSLGLVSASCGPAGKYWAVASGSSDSESIGPGSASEFLVPMAVNASADLIPFHPEGNLALLLTLETDRPQATGGPQRLEIETRTGSIDLPLREYHDPIDQAFLSVGALTARVEGLGEKEVNPGEGVVFPILVENLGDQERDLALDLVGINAGWAEFHEWDAVSVPAGDSVTVRVVVRVPLEAGEGERAELFAVLQDEEDAYVTVAVRLRAAVVDESTRDVPDETLSLEPRGSASADAMPLIAGILGFVFAAWFRRMTKHSRWR